LKTQRTGGIRPAQNAIRRSKIFGSVIMSFIHTELIVTKLLEYILMMFGGLGIIVYLYYFIDYLKDSFNKVGHETHGFFWSVLKEKIKKNESPANIFWYSLFIMSVWVGIAIIINWLIVCIIKAI
jgi:hypothetical protein